MLLDELKGLVGLSSGADVEAISGLYVDALPGISLMVIERIMTNEATVSDAWDKIEKRAILRLRTALHTEVNKCHKVSDISIIECLMVQNKLLLATSLQYLMGADVMRTRMTSSRINVATVDSTKPRELCEFYESEFSKELKVAVNGIDIHNSDCFPPEEEPECVQLIKTVTPII